MNGESATTSILPQARKLFLGLVVVAIIAACKLRERPNYVPMAIAVTERETGKPIISGAVCVRKQFDDGHFLSRSAHVVEDYYAELDLFGLAQFQAVIKDSRLTSAKNGRVKIISSRYFPFDSNADVLENPTTPYSRFELVAIPQEGFLPQGSVSLKLLLEQAWKDEQQVLRYSLNFENGDLVTATNGGDLTFVFRFYNSYPEYYDDHTLISYHYPPRDLSEEERSKGYSLKAVKDFRAKALIGLEAKGGIAAVPERQYYSFAELFSCEPLSYRSFVERRGGLSSVSNLYCVKSGTDRYAKISLAAYDELYWVQQTDGTPNVRTGFTGKLAQWLDYASCAPNGPTGPPFWNIGDR